MAHLRIDLDGVPLDDEDGRTTAIFRHRTTSAIHLSLPESVDVAVPLADLAEAALDLVSGKIVLRFRPEAGPRYRWLGPARTLSGAWTDRELLTHAPERTKR
jgi:hypothetical protein